MCIDNAWRDGIAAQIEDLGIRPGEFQHVCASADCRDSLTRDRDRLRNRVGHIHRNDVRVDKDQVGGQLFCIRRFASGQNKAQHPDIQS